MGTSAANITATYYPPSGSPVPFTQNNIAPGASATFYSVSNTSAALLQSAGGVVVTSTQPIVAIVNEAAARLFDLLAGRASPVAAP